MNIKDNNNKLLNIIKLLCLIFGLGSLIIFIPAIREFIISLGEKYMHRSLNHWLWNARMIKWELQLFLSLLVILLSIYMYQSNKEFDDNKRKIITWGITFFASLFFIILACQSKDVWYDETFSLGLARHSIKELIMLTAKDVHPPLYYLILKLAMIFFPGSATAAKIISVIPVILIMCISNYFFAKEFSYKSSILFTLLFLSMYEIFEYSIEIRMYTWCMLFCMLCCICSYCIYKYNNLKSYLLYVLFAECGAYCQYWTAFGIAMNFILISIICLLRDKKSIRNILITAAIGIVLYLPWAKVVISQLSEVSGEYWISKVTALNVIEYILYELPMAGIIKIISILLIGYFVKKTISDIKNKDTKSHFNLICFITPFILIACATIISIAVRPVFQAKYALPLSVFILFYIVITVNELQINKTYSSVIIVACLLCIIFNSTNIFLSEKITGRYNKAFTKMMDENLTDNTVFVFDKAIEKQIPYCIAYTYPNNKIYNFDLMELWTSAYFYKRGNLINNINNEKDICLVLNKDSEPPEEFSHVDYVVANICNYPELRFYFIKK